MAGDAECAIGAPIRPVRSFLLAAYPRLDMVRYRLVGSVRSQPLAEKSAQFQGSFRATIAFPSPNTITHLWGKPNIMLFSSPPRRGGLAGDAGRLHRTHLGAQGLDEILDVKRQRRAALHRDIGVEPRRLGDLQELDAGIAAMGDRELVDDGDAESRLHQRADRRAEARANGDVVGEPVARE